MLCQLKSCQLLQNYTKNINEQSPIFHRVTVCALPLLRECWSSISLCKKNRPNTKIILQRTCTLLPIHAYTLALDYHMWGQLETGADYPANSVKENSKTSTPTTENYKLPHAPLTHPPTDFWGKKKLPASTRLQWLSIQGPMSVHKSMHQGTLLCTAHHPYSVICDNSNNSTAAN